MSLASLLRAHNGPRVPGRGDTRNHFVFAEARERIVVRGWRAGFQKVNATKLLQSYCGYGLPQAKQIVDEILEKDRVEIALPEAVRPELIARKLYEFGANAEVVDTAEPRA